MKESHKTEIQNINNENLKSERAFLGNFSLCLRDYNFMKIDELFILNDLNI